MNKTSNTDKEGKCDLVNHEAPFWILDVGDGSELIRFDRNSSVQTIVAAPTGELRVDGTVDGIGVGASIRIDMPQSSSSSSVMIDNRFCSSECSSSLLLRFFFCFDPLLIERTKRQKMNN
jgi:hypothetical protein